MDNLHFASFFSPLTYRMDGRPGTESNPLLSCKKSSTLSTQKKKARMPSYTLHFFCYCQWLLGDTTRTHTTMLSSSSPPLELLRGSMWTLLSLTYAAQKIFSTMTNERRNGTKEDGKATAEQHYSPSLFFLFLLHTIGKPPCFCIHRGLPYCERYQGRLPGKCRK